MENLIKALTIFLKYRNDDEPLIFYDDLLVISFITRKDVSDEDNLELGKLGFIWEEDYNAYSSHKYVY